MEQAQFQKILHWFEILNQKIDALDQKLENKFQHLTTALLNLTQKFEKYRKQNNQEIQNIKTSIHPSH